MEELKMDRMLNQLGALKLVCIKPILYVLKCPHQDSISVKWILNVK